MEEDDVETTTTRSQPDGTTASPCLSATVHGHATSSGVCLSLGVQLGRPCLTGGPVGDYRAPVAAGMGCSLWETTRDEA